MKTRFISALRMLLIHSAAYLVGFSQIASDTKSTGAPSALPVPESAFAYNGSSSHAEQAYVLAHTPLTQAFIDFTCALAAANVKPNTLRTTASPSQAMTTRDNSSVSTLSAPPPSLTTNAPFSEQFLARVSLAKTQIALSTTN